MTPWDRDGHRWFDLRDGTPLAAYLSRFDPEDIDPGDLHPQEQALVADGTVQLCNPGFDEHLIGVATVPWFGWGHCALLAWHMQTLSGWPLMTLVDQTGRAGHTGVLSPAGDICDWRGAHSPDEAASEYLPLLHGDGVWEQHTPQRWAQAWAQDPARVDEMCGLDTHERHGRYGRFEVLLADWLARTVVAAAA